MNAKHHLSLWAAVLSFLALALSARAVGTWTPLVHQTPNIMPNGNPSLMLLLSDGTVMVENDPTGNGGTNWFRLTPDIHGSYINGTWSMLAPMTYSRAGCASDILINGQVFVAGGEYGTGGPNAEVYDPVRNVWRVIPVPTSLLNPANLSPIWGGNTHQSFGEPDSEVLPDGNVVVSPVAVEYAHETMIYNTAQNTFSAGPNLQSDSQSEASWVKLPDASILTIDPSSVNTERYIPSLNQWISDTTVPVSVYSGGELGPAFLLPNGKAIFFGGGTNTAIYTPSGNNNPGSWIAGPNFPSVGTNAQGMFDAPGAMLVDGKILLVTGTAGTFNGPVYFFEYDFAANRFAQIIGPTGASFAAAPYYTKLLDLPDGTVLWECGSPQIYDYKPDGLPLASGKPVINSVLENADGSYHLTGTGLGGISEGAAYGDDAQMATDFPLVRLTNNVGDVYYARTYNWTSTGVMTSNAVTSTEFALPAGLPAGSYSLVAVANGIASDPVPFTIPLTPPTITAVAMTESNLLLSCTAGLAGRTYYTLMSTNLAVPLSQWATLATNRLATNGNFSITLSNTGNPSMGQGYLVLKAR
jgi:Kelch motif